MALHSSPLRAASALVLTVIFACSGTDGTPAETSPSPSLDAPTPTAPEPSQSATPQGSGPTVSPTSPSPTEAPPSATPHPPTPTSAVTVSPSPTGTSTPAPEFTPTPGATASQAPTPTRAPTPQATACDFDPTEPPEATAAAPFGLEQRGASAGCNFDRFAEPPTGYGLERIYPNLSFSQPVQVKVIEGEPDRVFVLEKRGRVRIFPAGDDAIDSAAVFLDIRDRIQIEKQEQGLLDILFDPDYATNRTFYLFYTPKEPYRIVISRMKTSADDDTVAEISSEEVLLTIPQENYNHNGGSLAWGVDGYLYISVGDGGGQYDPYEHGQNTHTLPGSILRIDVSQADGERAYSIPPDNPFADGEAGRPEIFAWGFRNPWRMSIDPINGQLWAGDVGQRYWEELDLVELGKNYGWDEIEGPVCHEPSSNCDFSGKEPPIVTYHHSVGKSITGGPIYRGSKLPELYGWVIFGDYELGQIWALNYRDGQVLEQRLLIDTELPVASFGVDTEGEIIVVDYGAGVLHQLVADVPEVPTSDFPMTLSETGCFSDVAAREPAGGVIPYDVSSPLWSDGVDKARWFSVPDCDAQVTFNETEPWAFPDGTALFKDFAVFMREGDPTSRRLLETRLMLKLEGAWRGYTYKWNDTQTDAELLGGELWEDLVLTDAGGGQKSFTHYYPSREDCQACHTEGGGYALGLRTGFVNSDFAYASGSDNQLRALNHVGIFSKPVEAPYGAYAHYPSPADDQVDITKRARSYLQANCAHCHQPGANVRAAIDLRYETPLAETGACDVPPRLGELGLTDPRILAPGAPERSILVERMKRLDTDRMPPVATHVVDEVGVAAVEAWISSLSSCDEK